MENTINTSLHKKLLILLGIFVSSFVSAQDCPNQGDNNNLDSQAEVDEFLANNPNCTYIEELELSGDIHDISGFLSLTSVGYLYINDCPNLVDLSGFSNIDSIFGNLGFYDTEGLKNLCGLTSLKYIGKDLRLEETVSIESLDGLESLSKIDDDISIEENENLKDINALRNVSVNEGESIHILDNPNLTNCCGIQNILLNTADLNINIQNNPSLCSTEAEITEFECEFPISECITHTDDLATIDIDIHPNPARDYLNIENKTARKIDQLSIYNSLGQEVREFSSPSNSVSLQNLKSGLYVVEIKMGDSRKLTKIIVQ